MRISLRVWLFLAWSIVTRCEADQSLICDAEPIWTALQWPTCPREPSEKPLCEGEGCSSQRDQVWTHIGPCINTGDESDTPICVFTDATFAGGRGISFVTTPERARYIATIPAFNQPDKLKNPNPPIPGTPEAAAATRLYDIREIPGKGMGLIASTFIPRSTLIMANTASIMTDYRAFNDLNEEEYTTLQAAAVAHLPSPHQSLILNLSAHDPNAAATLPRHQLVERIMATNSFDIDPLSDDDPDQDNSFFTLFPDISRMNHDCRPNAEYLFLGARGGLVQTIRAARDIYPGEELTVSYLDPLQIRARRMARLKNNWGFDCDCAACTLTGKRAQESDRRVMAIQVLKAQLEEWSPSRARRSERDDLAMAELLVELYELERLWSMSYEAYALAALAYNAAGSAWDAVRYARKAVEYGVPMAGEEDETMLDMLKLSEDPWAHWSWKWREKGLKGEGKKEEKEEKKVEKNEGKGKKTQGKPARDGQGGPVGYEKLQEILRRNLEKYLGS